MILRIVPMVSLRRSLRSSGIASIGRSAIDYQSCNRAGDRLTFELRRAASDAAYEMKPLALSHDSVQKQKWPWLLSRTTLLPGTSPLFPIQGTGEDRIPTAEPREINLSLGRDGLAIGRHVTFEINGYV